MKIEILGTGCYNCVKLESLVDEVLQEIGSQEIEVIRVSDEKAIRKYITLDEIPGLVINGWLTSTGEVPDRETLRIWLSQTTEPEMTG